MPLKVVRGAGKYSKKTKRNRKSHRGGAVYSFDLNDKVGGLPAVKSLYKTSDSDCPMGGVNDSTLGNAYYSPVGQSGGSKRKSKNRTHSKRRNRSKRNLKNQNKHKKDKMPKKR